MDVRLIIAGCILLVTTAVYHICLQHQKNTSRTLFADSKYELCTYVKRRAPYRKGHNLIFHSVPLNINKQFFTSCCQPKTSILYVQLPNKMH